MIAEGGDLKLQFNSFSELLLLCFPISKAVQYFTAAEHCAKI